MTQQTDVLIIGADPTGLTVAIELARRNVNVRIIEQRNQPSTRSKALVVQARTLECLDILGVAEELIQRGYTSPGIDFSADAQKPLRVNMYGLDTGFPYILILPQAQTEAILERRLNQLGVKVERNSSLTHFLETETGVCATVEYQDCSQTDIEAKYLVGADGSRSTVREGLGLPFEGSPYSWTAFLGDVHMEGHYTEGETEQHSNDRGLASIVPFDDGSHRIVTIDRKYQNQRKKRKLDLKELQESISAILEKPVVLSQPKWLSCWDSGLRLAPRYQVGRVFIAGDAAHTHSPFGGQGMNTGIQDAFNLGWKLAFAVKGELPQTLLNTYDTERYKIGEQNLRTGDFLLRSLLLRQRWLRQMRELIFRIFIPLPFVQRKVAQNLSGLGVSYDTGVGKLAGKRIPDMELMSADRERVRLYQLLRFPGYTLILFINPNQVQSTVKQIDQILNSGDEMLKVHLILNHGLPQLHDFKASTLVDYRGDFETKLGAKTGRIFLVRPDAYIAFDINVLDTSTFEKQLKQWKNAKYLSRMAVTI